MNQFLAMPMVPIGAPYMAKISLMIAQIVKKVAICF